MEMAKTSSSPGGIDFSSCMIRVTTSASIFCSKSQFFPNVISMCHKKTGKMSASYGVKSSRVSKCDTMEQ